MLKNHLTQNYVKLLYVSSTKKQKHCSATVVKGYKNITFATSLDGLTYSQIKQANVLVIDLAAVKGDAFAAVSRIKKINTRIKVYASHDSLKTAQKVNECEFEFSLPLLLRLW